ncbi:MAG TPA: hypothetical protein PKJ95_00885 [Atribacterota bacterium]|nr:hypothetical protein [Atribacterota bacterium]
MLESEFGICLFLIFIKKIDVEKPCYDWHYHLNAKKSRFVLCTPLQPACTDPASPRVTVSTGTAPQIWHVDYIR